MPRYHILFSGQGVLLDRGAGDPIIGFIAPRVVKTGSELDAVNLAKIKILKQWKLDFNRDNKSGTPQLTTVQTTHIKNPFKRLSFGTELFFYRDNEERDALILNCQNALKHWFRIR